MDSSDLFLSKISSPPWIVDRAGAGDATRIGTLKSPGVGAGELTGRVFVIVHGAVAGELTGAVFVIVPGTGDVNATSTVFQTLHEYGVGKEKEVAASYAKEEECVLSNCMVPGRIMADGSGVHGCC